MDKTADKINTLIQSAEKEIAHCQKIRDLISQNIKKYKYSEFACQLETRNMHPPQYIKELNQLLKNTNNPSALSIAEKLETEYSLTKEFIKPYL